MTRPVALLLAAFVSLQGATAMAESRLTVAAADKSVSVSASARLAITVEIPATLTMELAPADAGTRLADSSGDAPVTVRLWTNQGSTTISCAASSASQGESDRTLLDIAMASVTAASGSSPASPSALTTGCGSLSLGSSGVNRWHAQDLVEPVARTVTASQP